jgi:hypothetical protein
MNAEAGGAALHADADLPRWNLNKAGNPNGPSGNSQIVQQVSACSAPIESIVRDLLVPLLELDADAFFSAPNDMTPAAAVIAFHP